MRVLRARVSPGRGCCATFWNNQCTAPVAAEATGRFRVTHPHHPLCGREFDLVSHSHIWDKDRVYYHDDRGRLRSLPTRWTSLAPLDLFEVVAEGRARFRPSDLLQLAELIEGLRAVAKTAK
jgi:hypothetical protein